MRAAADVLAAIGRNSQFMLLAGLLGGLLLPQAAEVLRAHIVELVVVLLFFAALRVDPRSVEVSRASIGHDAAVVIAAQLILPLAALGVIAITGWTGTFPTMLVLIAAASPITGSPPIAQILGLSGLTAMRLLVLGTLVLPLTSIVPLRLAFGATAELDLLEPALRLSSVIVVAVGGALLVRVGLVGRVSRRTDDALGGITAILLAVFVLALMDAIQPALLSRPLQVLGALLFTCAVCFGFQAAAAGLYCRFRSSPDPRAAGSVGIIAGNRNVALFLTALPAAEIEPLMLLVGCYQIPMYLTPLVMQRIFPGLCGRAPSERS